MPDSIKIQPTNRDVVNGRGRNIQHIPGNIKYRKLVEANKVSFKS